MGLTAPVYEAFASQGANGDVVLCALRKKSKLELEEGGKTLGLTTYFVLTGKGCPSSLRGTAVYPVLKGHFGATLVDGTNYS